MDEVHDVDVLAELRELRLRVAELEAQASGAPPIEERSTRRGMLRLAGAAVVGGAAATLIGAQPAAATTLTLGTTNDGATLGTSITSSNTSATFLGTSTSTTGTGLKGQGTGDGRGVSGLVSSPTLSSAAVAGEVSGTAGFALYASGGQAQLLLSGISGAVAPTVGLHIRGEIVYNDGGFFGCVVSGTPGTWRELAGTTSAGTFHAVTPSRVFDSRAAQPSFGLLGAGVSRTISVADGRDNNGTVTTPNLVPAGATAVAANITVTGTTGEGGYLSVNPGGNTSASSSTINWFGAGQNIANGVTLTLNASRQLTVVCGPGGGDTHFIVDIAGYYL